MAKKEQKFKKYSPDFKLSVIMDMRNNHLGYAETMRKHFPHLQSDRGFKFLQRWERIFLEEGAEGLMKERRGRNSAARGTRRGRSSKLDKKVEEDLIVENQRLRMENEYLKKLNALVQERIQRENKKK